MKREKIENKKENKFSKNFFSNKILRENKKINFLVIS